jgi:hypothetical protein
MSPLMLVELFIDGVESLRSKMMLPENVVCQLNVLIVSSNGR